MNLSLFEKTLKEEALTCYNDALHSLYKNPFDEFNDQIKKDVIYSEINQALGRKAYSTIANSNLSSKQMQIANALIHNYRTRIITKINSL